MELKVASPRPDEMAQRLCGLANGKGGFIIIGVADPSKILDQKVRMELAMRYIHEHGSILNREYRDLTGVSEQTALRDLEMLVEQGKLKKIGKTRLRRYELA